MKKTIKIKEAVKKSREYEIDSDGVKYMVEIEDAGVSILFPSSMTISGYQAIDIDHDKIESWIKMLLGVKNLLDKS